MDPLLSKNFISTKEASELSGYNPDYLGRLCRTGRISGNRVGRSWVINRASLLSFVRTQEMQKIKNSRQLAKAREVEYQSAQKTKQLEELVVKKSVTSPYSVFQEQAVAVLIALAAVNSGLFIAQAKIFEDSALLATSVGQSTIQNTNELVAALGAHSFDSTDEFASFYTEGGVYIYEGINSFLSLYINGIQEVGDGSLVIGEHAANGLAFFHPSNFAEPIIETQIAFGSSLIDLSSSILRGYESGVTVFADTSVELPSQTMVALYRVGDVLSSQVAAIPPAINKFDTFAVTETANALAYAADDLGENAVALDTAISDQTLGVLGATALAYDNTKNGVTEVLNVRLNQPVEEISARSLAAAPPALPDLLQFGRSAALFTYETIQSLFDSAGSTLAFVFGPQVTYIPVVKEVVAPTPAPTTTVVTNDGGVTNQYITQNFFSNPISYVTGGVTEEFVYKLVGDLRDDVNEDLRDLDADSGGGGGGGLSDITGESIEDLMDVAAMTKDFGDLLYWNGSEWTDIATSSLGIGAGSGSPGGANTQVQYNNGGLFAGDSGFTYNESADRLTIVNASTTNLSSTYSSSTNGFFGSLSIGSLSGLLKATAGVVSTASAGVDFENPLSFAYPLIRTADVISLAFGTTTANTWSAHNIFTSIFATNASSTNATTTNLAVMNSFALGSDTFTDLTGAGLTASSGALTVDDVTPAMLQAADFGEFTCNGTNCAIDAESIGIEELSDVTSMTETLGDLLGWNGTTWTDVATSSLNIAISDTTGTLEQTRGGTGITSYTAGDILYADVGGNLAKLGIGSAGQVLKVVGGLPAWGADLTSGGGGGSGGAWSTTTDDLAIYPVDPADVVIVGNTATTTANSILEVFGMSYFSNRLGIGTTTPGAMLSVAGNGLLNGAVTALGGFVGPIFTATSTTGTSTLPNLSVTTLGIGGDFITDFVGTGLTLTGNTLATTLGTVIDLTTEVTGVLPVANGGTGASSLSDLITLGTHTVGNYVATVTGTANQITVSGSGSENAGVTLSIPSQFNIQNASTTNISANTAAFGGTGTTTISSAGLVNTPGITATNASTTNISSTYASSTHGLFGNLSVGSLSGLLQATAGVVSTAVAGVDFENPLSFTYPLIRTTNTISLAFGTTTANTWGAHNIFSSLFATNASTTNATTTSFGINAETFTDLTGTGLQNIAGALSLNATGDWTGLFDGQEGTYYLDRANHTGTQLAATISDFTSTVNSFINGSTTIPKTYTSNTFTLPQIFTYASTTGISGTYASSTNAFFGNLSIGSLTGVLKATAGAVSTGLVNLASEVTGTLPIANGGTGTSTPGVLGDVLSWNGTNWQGTATSSLGLPTGSGATDRVAYWSSANTLTSNSRFTFDGTTASLLGGARLTIGDTGDDRSLTLQVVNDAQTLLSNSAGDIELRPVGNVGIATSSPYAKLSVVGQVVASHFTATTTASSTFPTLYVTGRLYDSTGVAGTNGMVLQTTGSATQWVATSSLGISGGSVGGSDTQVQYNNGGSFAGDAGLTYNATDDRLTVVNASTTNLSSSYASSTNAFLGALTIGGDLITDFVGTGLALSGSTLTTTLGTVVDLASEITGTLPVGNGGTGATSFTQGSVIFSNGTTLTQDNSNFFISTVTKFLGIGTSTPASRLAVSGGASIGANYNIAAPTNGLIVEGNVGIGTSTSLYKTTIYSADTDNILRAVYAGASGSGGGVSAQFVSTDGAALASGDRLASLQFGGSSSGTTEAVGAAIEALSAGAWSGSSAPTDLTFATAPSGSTNRSERLRITSAGNVGIGTTSPVYELTVGPGGDVPTTNNTHGLLYLTNNGATSMVLRDSTNDAELFAYVDGSNGGIFGTVSNHNLIFRTNNANNAVLTTAGYFGVGTTSPFAKLSVQATAGQTAPVFQVASSSVATKFLSVAADGFGTTTLSGLTVSGSATSTSNVGFNLTGGCFAISGTCIGSGGGAVSSVANADGTLTISPTTGSVVASLNLGNANQWTALQRFTNATSTIFSNTGIAYFGGTATSTFSSTGALTLSTALAVTSGGTGATSLTDLITLATHTTGAYVATVSGNSQITVSGVGAENATASLSITADSIGDSQLAFNTGQNLTTASSPSFAGLTLTGNLTLSGSSANILLGSNYLSGDGGDEGIIVDSVGKVGIGTSTPGHILSVQGTVSVPQFALAYDTTRYANLQTNSSGDFFIDAQGGDISALDENLFICASGACPSGTPSGTGNIIAETAIGIASSTPWAKLAVGADGAIVTTEKILSDSATISVDWRNGNQQKVTLGGNRTINFSGYIDGQTLRLVVCQDGSGTRTISWGTQILWAGGSAPSVTTTANKCDVWSFLATQATSTLKVFGTQSANF